MKTLFLALSIALLQPTATATDAWALVGGGSAFVLATLNNPSMYDIYIVSARSKVAESIEFVDGDKKLDSITIPAYGSVEMKAGEKRLRVLGLKGQFKAGDELKLTLETDGGASIEVAAIVKSTEP